MTNKILKVALGVSILIIVGLGFLGFKADQKNFEISKNLDIFYSLVRELNLFYVDEVKPDKLIKTGIDDMLETLDPYTVYIPESEMDDFKFMTTGEYAGIGAMISKRGNQIIVAEPYEGFPAQKNGLRAGDVFLEVDGKPVDKMVVSDVSEILKGPAKKPVKVKMQRSGEKKPFTLDIVREEIQIDPVTYYGMIDTSTGYLRLSSFTDGCSENVKTAILDLRDKKGANKLVLDLRSNPGGLLGEAVKVTNLFVNHGQEIVSTKGKVSQWDKTYRATEQPVDSMMPLVVLVNSSSASASEIVAGALQDHNKAILVGTQTFGKGTVQTIYPLSDGSGLRITTSKYYTPSLRSIQEKGITPDVTVEDTLDVFSPADKYSKTYREKDLISQFKDGDTGESLMPQNDTLLKAAGKGGDKDIQPEKRDTKEKIDKPMETALSILKNWDTFRKSLGKNAS